MNTNAMQPKFMWNMGGTLDNFSSELAEIQHV